MTSFAVAAPAVDLRRVLAARMSLALEQRAARAAASDPSFEHRWRLLDEELLRARRAGAFTAEDT